MEDGGSPETQAVSVNGEDAVYLNVLRVPGGNTLDIVDSVKKVVADLKDLPPGMTVKPVFDQSTFVRTTYHGLKQEVVQALVLIALVILARSAMTSPNDGPNMGFIRLALVDAEKRTMSQREIADRSREILVVVREHAGHQPS